MVDFAPDFGAPPPDVEPRFAERDQPFSTEAELAVLGGMFIEPDALARMMEQLAPEDFYREAHRHLFAAMMGLFRKNRPVDAFTLQEELRQTGKMDGVGLGLIDALYMAVPTAANIQYHAGIVKAKARIRALIHEAEEVVRRCHEPGNDPDALLEEAEAAIFKLGKQKADARFWTLRDTVLPAFDRIERAMNAGGLDVTGLASGYPDLDALTAGFQPGDLIIIAARPSMGKTAFALNVAQHAALSLNRPVGFWSLEMSKDALTHRLLASEARVDSHRIRTGRLADDDLARLATAAGYLNTDRILIDDRSGLSALELRASARRLKAERPDLALIIVDYLQLLTAGAGGGKHRPENRQQEVAEISRTLKQVAKELDVPVVALSQLSRDVERRPDKRPLMSDLRESGAIEQDADLILFLYRPEVYYGATDSEGNSLEGVAELIIGKQRAGAQGAVRLTFLKEITRFESFTGREEVPRGAMPREGRGGKGFARNRAPEDRGLFGHAD
jgi:replicative DNA helicase